MSHSATNWAIEQRGLKAAAKLVLWHLCDRFNPDLGCFPDQSRLADDVEMSRSSLNDQLKTLEDKGLIERVQRKSGGKKMKSTMYFFPFEGGRKEDFGRQKPCPNSGHGDRKTVSENEQKPCPKNGENRVRISDSNPVREPVSEPVTFSEAENGNSEMGADAPEREKTGKEVERDFDLAWHDYDQRLKSSRSKSLEEWIKLSPADREIAAKRIPIFKKGWLNDGGTKSMLVAFSTYLSDRRFEQVADPKPANEPVDDGKQALTKFGKAWCVVRLAWLRTGQKPVRDRFDLDGKPIKVPDYMRYREMYPKVHAMDNQPVQRLSPENAVKPEILAECVAVAQGSADWQAWVDYHAAMDWPMVEVGDWNKPVWFPAHVPSKWAGYQEVAA